MRDKVFFNNLFGNIHNINDLKHKDATPNNDKSETVLFNNSPDTQWVNFSQKPEGTIPPERKKELEEWTLDFDFYINNEDLEFIELDDYPDATNDEKEEKLCDEAFIFHEDTVKMYDTWYQNYLNTHNGVEMNFLTARQYLIDNPNEKSEIKEFIKRCFGICDGDVSNNRQMGLGVCALLSAREKMGDDKILNDKVENIVKQNDDGTVTVTLFGIKIKNENNEYEPMQFTFKNEEIKESYTILDSDNCYVGGPTDPDDAALVIAFKKLAEFLNKNYPIKSEEEEKKEIEQYYDDKINKLQDLLSEIFSKLSAETDKLYSFLLDEDKVKELKEKGNAPNLMKLMDEAKDWSEPAWHLIVNIRKNQEIYFNEIESLNAGIDIENFKKLFKDENNVGTEINKFLKAKEQEINKNLYKKLMYSYLYEFPKKGVGPVLSLTILTGMGDNIKSYKNKDEIEKYFQSIDYNVKDKFIIAHKTSKSENADLLYEHEYMIKDIYKDKDDNKYITFKNPHNEISDYGEDAFPTKNMISGELGCTFTLKVDETLLNNLDITVISNEPVKDQKAFYKIPDDFTLENTYFKFL